MPEERKEMGFQIKCVNNMIRRKLDIRFAAAGLEELIGMQGPVLGYIHGESQKRDIFQRDVEKAFNIRRSTATVLLQNLEQKGYIVRQPVNSDGRLKKIVMTKKAVQHHLIICKEIDAFNKELETGISPEEKELFLNILDKVKKNLE